MYIKKICVMVIIIISDNPAWFDGSRAMITRANLITRKIGSDVAIPTNINVEDGLKDKL